jgi:hypothetical protein
MHATPDELVCLTRLSLSPSVTVSISAIMNESATLKLDTAAAVAVYISSLISHNEDLFATHSFDIVSISICTQTSTQTCMYIVTRMILY